MLNVENCCRPTRELGMLALLTLSVLFLTSTAWAQSQLDNDPASILGDILVASCSQDTQHFGAFLTARNATAFAAMSSSAQATLLERFVLLDQAGKASSKTDASGNIVVLCTTPSVSTQLQIGKPEIRDNIAYLPLVVQDAAESSAATARRVIMG